jgi:cytolysin (calcineurin-like family phosphatase)
VISAAAELGPEMPIFIELPYAPGWEAAVELIEAAGLYGKIAAGQAEPRYVVKQLSILIEADLPFKITCAHHGDWLSLLLVVEALVAGANLDDAAALMQLDDHRLEAAMSAWDPTSQSRVRRRVRRLGIGQVQEVISNLTMYGELQAP